MLHELKPKIRAGRAPSATATAGGLSTVIDVGGVERAEEERLPALRPGLHGGGVEGVGPAGGAEVPQVEHGGAERAAPRARAAPSAAGRRRAAAGAVRPGASGARRVAVSAGISGAGSRAGLPVGRSGRKTQARNSTKRSAVAARLAATSTASSTTPAGVGRRRASSASAPLVSASPSAEHDQALQLVAGGAVAGRARRR